MTRADGSPLILNGVAYQLGQFLGRGAITDAFLAIPEGHDDEVVVRILQPEHGPGSRAEAAMLTEVSVLTRLNHSEDTHWLLCSGPLERLQRAKQTVAQRGVIALLDSGISLDGRKCNVQERAPEPFVAAPVSGLSDERRVVAVFVALARVVDLVHRADLSLCDFDPASDKANRLRVALDTESGAFEHLKVIDWNVTCGPELRGRDLLYFGGHLYHALFQEHLNGAEPPQNFATTTPGWSGISLGIRQILERIFHRLPARRYQNAHELLRDLSWWHQMLGVADQAAVEQLADQHYLPSQRRALLDLRDRLAGSPPSGQRERAQRDEEAEREQIALLELDVGKLLLRDGRSSDAAREFQRVLTAAPPGSELARQAWVYARSAEAAAQLTGAEADQQAQAIEQARNRLLDGPPADAHAALSALSVALGDHPARPPIELLRLAASLADEVASARQLLERVRAGLPANLPALAAYRPPESQMLARLDGLPALSALADETLRSGVPADELRAQGAELRAQAAELMGTVRACAVAAAAVRELDKTLAGAATMSDATEALAAYDAVSRLLTTALDQRDRLGRPLGPALEQLADEARARQAQARTAAERLAATPALFAAGDYAAAAEQSAGVRQEQPAWLAARTWHTRAEQGLDYQRRVDEAIAYARQRLAALAPDDARATLGRALALDGALLDAVPGAPAGPPPPAFVLTRRPELEQLLALSEQLAPRVEQIARHRKTPDYAALRHTLAQAEELLAHAGTAAGPGVAALYAEAGEGLKRLAQAELSLDRARQGEALEQWLSKLAESLGNDQSPSARALREEAAAIALRQIASEPELAHAARLSALASAVFRETAAADDLARAHGLLAEGQQIVDRLGRGLLPAWLGEPAWARALAELGASIEGLPDEPPLNALATTRAHWRARLGELVEGRAALSLAEGRSLVATGDAQGARTLVFATRAALPQALRAFASEQWNELDDFAAALDLRLAAEHEVDTLGGELDLGRIGLAGAAERLAQLELPTRPDVAAHNLIKLRELLHHAAAIVVLEDGEPPSAAALAACRARLDAARRISAGLEKLGFAAPLRRAVEQLALELEGREQAILARASLIVNRYDPLSGEDLALTAQLYRVLSGWQAEAPGTPAREQVAQTLQAFDQRVDQLLAQARRHTEELSGAAEQARLAADLDRLVQLIELRRDHAALATMNAWRHAVDELRPGVPQAQDDGPPEILGGLERLSQSLRRLRDEIWPRLGDEALADDAPLAALGRSVETMLGYAREVMALSAPGAQQSRLSPGDLIARIKRAAALRAQAPRAGGHWLLGPYAQLLEEVLQLAATRLSAELALLLDAALGAPAIAAAARLGALMAEAGDSADAVASELEDVVRRRELEARTYGEEAAAAASRLHWQAVLRATERWRDDGGPLAQLHGRARSAFDAAVAQSGGPAEPPPGPAASRHSWRQTPMALLLTGGLIAGLAFLGGFALDRPAAPSTAVTIVVTAIAGPTPTAGPDLAATVTNQVGQINGAILALGATLTAPTPTLPPSPTPVVQAQNVVEGIPVYSSPDAAPGEEIVTLPLAGVLYVCSTTPENGRLPVSNDAECDTPAGWISQDVIVAPNEQP